MVQYARTIFILLITSVSAIAKLHYTFKESEADAEAWEKAATWLLNQRNDNLHWGKKWNPWAVLALSRSPGNSNVSSSAEFQLAVKQMDIDFLHDRLRYGDAEVYTDRLITLTTSLISTCRSPKNYYDYDLLDGILNHRNKFYIFGFVSGLLVACNGEGSVTTTDVRKLINLLNPSIHYVTEPDTFCMAIMAAKCLVEHYSYGSLTNYIEKMLEILLARQFPDGSFETNIVKTALAIQTLDAVENVKALPVKKSSQAAKQWLKSKQSPDGSFLSDMMDTVEAMLALSGTGGRARIHLNNCRHEKLDEAVTIGNKTVEVHVWKGQPVERKESFLMKVPINSSVYDVLRFAEAKGHFKFETAEFSTGPYLTTIDELTEDISTLKGWAIYVFPPEVNHARPTMETLLETGISTHRPGHGERILFWYRRHPEWSPRNPSHL